MILKFVLKIGLISILYVGCGGSGDSDESSGTIEQFDDYGYYNVNLDGEKIDKKEYFFSNEVFDGNSIKQSYITASYNKNSIFSQGELEYLYSLENGLYTNKSYDIGGTKNQYTFETSKIIVEMYGMEKYDFDLEKTIFYDVETLTGTIEDVRFYNLTSYSLGNRFCESKIIDSVNLINELKNNIPLDFFNQIITSLDEENYNFVYNVQCEDIRGEKNAYFAKNIGKVLEIKKSIIDGTSYLVKIYDKTIIN